MTRPHSKPRRQCKESCRLAPGVPFFVGCGSDRTCLTPFIMVLARVVDKRESGESSTELMFSSSASMLGEEEDLESGEDYRPSSIVFSGSRHTPCAA